MSTIFLCAILNPTALCRAWYQNSRQRYFHAVRLFTGLSLII
ncbi:DUF3667 domain-containing protein [Pantoea stewartii subsp. stewartii]|nr:DUF3667 domain-containing protein [Pantoea stewartii subsp. stewartii]